MLFTTQLPSTSSDYVSVVATESLGGHRVVTDAITYADQSNELHINRVIGFTTGAASSGGAVNVQSSGVLKGFSGLSTGPIYLSINGHFTQVVPVTGFIQQLGNALSDTSVLVHILLPTQLN